MPTSPIRIGLVGLGKIARDQHLSAIAKDSRFHLTATADPAHGLGDVPAYRSMTAMLAAEHGLDAVAICTPPSARVALAQEAMEAGLSVLLEKPPAAAPSQVAALAHLARRAGVALFAAWHSRESKSVEMARAWLSNRGIDAVRVIWREDIRQWHPGQDWLLGAGGFGVFDPAINAFSILTEILPPGISVEGATLTIPENRHAPVSAMVQMRGGAGAPITADLDILHTGPQQWDIIVETEGQVLELKDGGHRLLIDGELRLESVNDEYPRIYQRFADLFRRRAVEADATPLMLVADAVLLGETIQGEGFAF